MVGGQSPADKAANEQIGALFNNINKMTINYANGSTLTLEGEALTNFISFQKSMIFMYNTFNEALAKNTAEKAKTPPQQPLTRTTLGDQLNRNKKGQNQ